MRKIQEEIAVKGLTIKNRLVMPPMATGKSNADGSVSDELCAYYAEKSAGGYIGLIITEHCYISEDGKASPGQMAMDEHCRPEDVKKLTDVIHGNGSAAFCQLNHAGSRAKQEVTGQEVLTVQTINQEKVIADFAQAALRAKAGGFDGVEIHSAHGYLLNQFYSPLENKGADLEQRIRLHLAVIRAVREAVGEDYPIALRLGACDYMEGGSTLEDAVYACRQFEAAGVDLLDISGGFCGFMRKDCSEPGWFGDASAAVKAAVGIPVIVTGGITEPGQLDPILEENKADMVGVGRAILTDSRWAERAMTV